MKTYILPLKQKSGLLSELQSDTIYGHFCWRLKERLGDEKLTEFISLYKNRKPVFILSDGLLQVNGEIRFPRPYIFNKPEIKETKAEKVLEFVITFHRIWQKLSRIWQKLFYHFNAILMAI